ncbi:MAG: MBL fold metallo-hydrolase, partial [Geminicoccaceae bacterium]
MGAEGNSQAIRVVDRLQLTVGESLKEMSEGIFGLRLALPFALDHVNIWFLKDQGAWTCIDTGIANDATRSLWSSLLAGGLDGRSVGRLIATHFHPDHMGLAGWLCAATGAEFWTSRTEWLMARALAHDDSAGFVETGRHFDHRAGLDQVQLDQRAARGNVYRTRAVAPPATHRRIQDGDEITIDGGGWQVLIGRGHAPEMIC